jgi:hypothetical protein
MRVRRMSLAWVAVLLLALAGSAASSSAATLPGQLQCIADSQAVTGPKGASNCSTKAPGLNGAIDAIVSHDGADVYATTTSAGELTTFARNLDGTLTELGCFGPNDYNRNDDGSHVSACSHMAPGLNGALGEVLSPDGMWLYVAAVNDDTVTWFSRDPSTGALAWAGCVQDVTVRPRAPEYQPGCTHVTNLNGARWVAISPDGANAYVANSGHSVSEFSRDQSSGALSPLPGADSCIKDVNDTATNRRGVGYASIANCSQTGSALWYNREIAVSPDGTSVYSTDNYGYAIAEFARNPATGAPASCVSDPSTNSTNRCGQTAVDMKDVVAVRLTPDGSRLWAANFGPLNSVQQFGLVDFAVDPGSGALTPIGCIQDDKQSTNPGCAGIADGLRGARSVAFSPDGSFLYVTASVASTITAFSAP